MTIGLVQWKAIGPGILFAGAAIGVSHLVQSTRAGASFGLGLVVVVVLANLLKYPAFSFGPRYAAATGCSLLEGYRRQGRPALLLFAVLTVGTMFTVLAAVSFTTAGLLQAMIGLPWDPAVISGGLLALSLVLIRVGHYRWLDGTVKVVVALLTVLTVVATVLVLGEVPWRTLTVVPSISFDDVASFTFIAALVGWMPSAIDISVWHSLWAIARRQQTRHAPTISEAMLDFNVGYITTAILALCFLLLGAALIHGRQIEVPGGAGAFAVLVLDLYGSALGAWARPLIGVAAFTVMLSTTLTVVDGFPRALSALYRVIREPETPGQDIEVTYRGVYWLSALGLVAGAMVILVVVRGRLLGLVDIATLLSFLTSPALAFLNHRAVMATPNPPGRGMQVCSMIAIVLLTGFACWFLYIRFALT